MPQVRPPSYKLGSGTGVGATLTRRIAPHDNAREAGEARRERFPDEEAKILEARLLETRDLVEHPVVEPLAHRRARALDGAEIRDEAGRRIGRSRDRHLHLEGMAVDAAVRVTFGERFETM